jgi:hypothetical protein
LSGFRTFKHSYQYYVKVHMRTIFLERYPITGLPNSCRPT